MGYRGRVALAGIVATFALAHIGQLVSEWAPWLASLGVAAACGALVAEANDGAGVGGLAAGGGGFLFAFSTLASILVPPVVTGEASGVTLGDALLYSAVQSVNLFALFGLAGMLAGGVAGLWVERRQDEEASDEEAAEGEEETAQREERAAGEGKTAAEEERAAAEDATGDGVEGTAAEGSS